MEEKELVKIIEADDVESLKESHKNENDILNRMFPDIVSTFYYICQCGSLNCLKYCVENGCDINALYANSKAEITPFIGTIYSNNKDAIDYLIEKGVALDFKSSKESTFDGKPTTYLTEALYKENYELTNYLLNNVDIPISIADYFSAVRKGWDDTVEIILNKGIDINAVERLDDGTDYNALFTACDFDHVSTAVLLMNRGIDINYKNSVHEDWTALFRAVDKENIELVQELLNHGADVNITSSEKRSCLQLACLYGNKEITEMLLSHGADIEFDNGIDYSASALHAAVHERRVNVVKVLLEKGANPEHGYNNEPPIICAIMNEDKEIIELLVNYGANVYKEVKFYHDYNVDGTILGGEVIASPYHLAELEDKTEICEFLKKIKPE